MLFCYELLMRLQFPMRYSSLEWHKVTWTIYSFVQKYLIKVHYVQNLGYNNVST